MNIINIIIWLFGNGFADTLTLASEKLNQIHADVATGKMLINLCVVVKHFTDLALTLKIHFKLSNKATSAAQHVNSDDACQDVTQAEDARVVRDDEMLRCLSY